jgi:hypothetical protein
MTEDARAQDRQHRCRPASWHTRLIASWRRALDAFGDALSSDRRYYSTLELNELERDLAADRRWLEHFAGIRIFP